MSMIQKKNKKTAKPSKWWPQTFSQHFKSINCMFETLVSYLPCTVHPSITDLHTPFITLQPQHNVPDLFIWLMSNNKRVAYARIRTRDLLYSSNRETRGSRCGKTMTLFLKVNTHAENGFQIVYVGIYKVRHCMCVCSLQGSVFQACRSKRSSMCICGMGAVKTPFTCWRTFLQDSAHLQAAPTSATLQNTCPA